MYEDASAGSGSSSRRQATLPGAPRPMHHSGRQRGAVPGEGASRVGKEGSRKSSGGKMGAGRDRGVVGGERNEWGSSVNDTVLRKRRKIKE